MTEKINSFRDFSDIETRTVQFHKTLNPVVWDDLSLKPVIRDALLKVAQTFVTTWNHEIPVSDIILTGSNANYNWTIYSDLDIHVVVNMSAIPEASKSFVESYLKAKKELWNLKRKITVKGIPIEVYAQDSEEVLVATGVFSILSNEWVVKPKKVKPSVNHPAVQAKVEDLVLRIRRALFENDTEALRAILKEISQLRKGGLQVGGEFSTENLVFKVLRNSDMIERIRRRLGKLEDKTLTLEQAIVPFKEYASYK